MNNLALCVPLFLLVLAPHGGVYRGPGGAVPPGGAPAGPGTAVGPGGSAVTDWQVWWSFNRDPYLELKQAIHQAGSSTGDDDFFLGFGQHVTSPRTTRPGGAALASEVVPALLDTLAGAKIPDLVTSCLMALAKIGQEANGPEITPVLVEYLAHSNQEIAETAAVALGVLGEESATPALAELLQDSPSGRELVGRGEVPYRTRAFAAYGLGLIGQASEREDVRRFVVFHLAHALERDRTPSRDLATACLLSLGLVPLEVADFWPVPGEEPARVNSSREAQVQWLMNWFSTTRASDLTRVHAPVAMARLCAGAGDRPKEAVARLLLLALVEHGRENQEVRRAAVIALGRLGDDDRDELDRRIRDKLRKLAGNSDAMIRDLARIALARAASRPGRGPEAGTALAPVRAFLLRDLAGGKSSSRPWTILALGVLEFRRQAAGLEVSSAVTQALHQVLRRTRTPRDVGALCTALGLARDSSAEKLLLGRLTGGGNDTVKAQAGVGLGMIGARESASELRALALDSVRKPILIRELSTGLALLGDVEILEGLIEALREARTLSSQSALAASVGRIGDARAIEPLLALLRDRTVTVATRAWTAAALGVVGDRRDLPWNSPLAVDVHYGMPPSTLTDGLRGVLDLL